MNKRILILVFIILLAATGSLVYFHISREKENRVCFKNNCYFVEIARTQEEKERGLMDRNNLGKNEGMLFVFDQEDIYSFWMENTLIPLDIIWLDKNYKVAYIFKNAQPCKEECENIIPDQPAQYVLELNAGETEKIGLKIKDKFNFSN